MHSFCGRRAYRPIVRGAERRSRARYSRIMFHGDIAEQLRAGYASNSRKRHFWLLRGQLHDRKFQCWVQTVPTMCALESMDAARHVLSVQRIKRKLKRVMEFIRVSCASNAMLLCVWMCALHVTMQRTCKKSFDPREKLSLSALSLIKIFQN